MNYKIRTTAHGFRFQFSAGFDGMPKPGYLAFWYHPDGEKIKHVAIFSDAMLIMNARNRFCDQPLSLEIKRRAGAKYELRRLDWGALADASAEGRSAYGVDEELVPLLGLFDGETL